MGMQILRGPVRSLLVAMMLGFGGGTLLSMALGSRSSIVARAPWFALAARRLSPSNSAR